MALSALISASVEVAIEPPSFALSLASISMSVWSDLATRPNSSLCFSISMAKHVMKGVVGAAEFGGGREASVLCDAGGTMRGERAARNRGCRPPALLRWVGARVRVRVGMRVGVSMSMTER